MKKKCNNCGQEHEEKNNMGLCRKCVKKYHRTISAD